MCYLACVLAVLGLGFALGARHALDADHVAAVSTLVARSRGVRASSLAGAAWGLGHSLALVVVALLVVFLEIRLPARLAPVLELARKAVAADPKNSYYLNTHGAMLYRAGQYEKAIEQLEAAASGGKPEDKPSDFLFLAMAHHRLAKKDEAGKWLQKAVQWLDQANKVNPGSVPGGPEFSWEIQMEFRILRCEAETLLKGTSAAPEPNP